MLLYFEQKSNLMKPLIALTVLLAIGTAGFRALEGWSVVDSLWMAVITLSTVGFGEPGPMSEAGRLFTIFYIIAGVSVATYTVGTLSRKFLEGEFQNLIGRRRIMTKIRNMKDHYIIAGYGRIGQMVAREFEGRPFPFVVIERDESAAGKLPPEYPVLVGDATEEATLVEAGIANARGLVAVLPTDADNLFLTLSARELNPKLLIISRYEEERTKQKLHRAGADKVVSPYIIGGKRMAMAALRPAVIDFIELATQSESLGLQMEEIEIPADSAMAGTSLVDSNIRSTLDIIVVAVKKRSGHMIFNPGASLVIETGDRLIAIGERNQLVELEGMVRAKEARK